MMLRAALEIAISELRSEEISATGIVVDVSDLDSVRSFRDQILLVLPPTYFA